VAKPAPTPIPVSALRCPVHREALTETGLCGSCVHDRHMETFMLFALSGVGIVAIVVGLLQWVFR